jgi:ATP-dependent DNA ligase
VRLPLVPMRAEPATTLEQIAASDVLFEPKFDGYRLLIIREPTGVRLQSRNLKDLTRYFPDVAQAALDLPPDTIVDGELLIWDQKHQRPSFGLLGRRITAGRTLDHEVARHPAHVICFDLLQVGGHVVMHEPLRRRRRLLEDLLHTGPTPLTLCPQSADPAQADVWLHDWTAAGIAEGIVIKPADAPYRPGHLGWRKLRARETTEAIIAGVTGDVDQPVSLLLARTDHNGRLRYIGRTTPLGTAQRREVAGHVRVAEHHPWPQPLPPSWQGYLGKPEPLRYQRVAAEVVAEIATDSAYEHGRFRHPIRFLRIRAELHPMQLPRWSADDWNAPRDPG